MLCWLCDGHCLPMWLGCALSIVNLMIDCNYRTFLVEWWIPMCSNKEPKSFVAKEYWTRRWTLEVTHPKRVSVTTIFYFYRMPTHKDKRSPKTHLILAALTVMALANLTAVGAITLDNVSNDYDK